MSHKNHLNFIITALIIIGCAIFFYKILYLNIPITKNKNTELWKVEAEININPEKNKPIKISLLLPQTQKNFKIIDEKFVSPNYGQIINEEKVYNSLSNSRMNIWTKRRSNHQESLFYSFTVMPFKNNNYDTLSKEASNNFYKFNNHELTAAKSILKKAREESADSPSFAANVVKILKNNYDYTSSLLLNNNYTDKNIAIVTSRILNVANIKSRVTEGFRLKANQSAAPSIITNTSFETLLQIWDGNEWNTLDIKNNKYGMPNDFFIWNYDNNYILKTDGIKNISFSISYKSFETNALKAQQDNSIFTRFSLLSLPIKTQKQFATLVTIPLGILVILILRSIIGLNTIGTFMPVLIALAFKETGLLLGLASFGVVIFLGLILRFYLENLKLLAIPRLGSILAIVIFIILLISIMFNELHIANPSSLSIFPLVIITMTIERMAILWEERGPSASISQCAGSFLAASIIYLIINQQYIKYILFVFPELSAVIIALILLIGKYRGFRLSEVFLFQQLVKT